MIEVVGKKSKDSNLALRIKSLRKQHGWSQAQLADISRVSERTIQRAESGDAVDPDTIQALARAFEITVEQLQSPTKQAKSGTPKVRFLIRVATGKEAFDIVGAADLSEFDHDEAASKEEAVAIGDFFQELKDASEIWSEIEPANRVEITFSFTDRIRELEAMGFYVFGHRRRVLVTANGADRNIPMDCATVVIKRKDAPMIIKDPIGRALLPVLDEVEPRRFG